MFIYPDQWEVGTSSTHHPASSILLYTYITLLFEMLLVHFQLTWALIRHMPMYVRRRKRYLPLKYPLAIFRKLYLKCEEVLKKPLLNHFFNGAFCTCSMLPFHFFPLLTNLHHIWSNKVQKYCGKGAQEVKDAHFKCGSSPKEVHTSGGEIEVQRKPTLIKVLHFQCPFHRPEYSHKVRFLSLPPLPWKVNVFP